MHDTRGASGLQVAAVQGLWLAASLWLCGCSFLFVEGPPAGHAELRYFDCTESRLAPVADTVVAASYGVSAVTQGVAVRSHVTSSIVGIGLAVGLATLAGASAVHGFAETNGCERAKAAWRDRLQAPTTFGCARDLDCQGAAVCEHGTCVLP